tara:strand:- start:8 stop:667 length:660 start_codon:yes stop_codon:yes gene_type:complete
MMSLFFSGCSITWGDELEDRLNERYSTLVSNHYGCQHYNLSERGISNDNIVRNAIKYLQNYNPDVVIIQFTVASRMEYYQVNEKICRFTIQPTFIPPELKQTHRDYYTKVYNEVLGVENMWKNIFLFDAYCKSVGQKYISLVADHFDPSIRKPEKFYKFGNGYWRGLCKDYEPVWMHMGLLQHTKENPNYYANGLSGGHPSAEGHKIIANKIIELIDTI